MQTAPNPHSRPNSDVLLLTLNGSDIVQRSRGRWVVDFCRMAERDAALYEMPFAHVRQFVKPLRDQSRDAQRRASWWLHGRTGDDFRAAVRELPRFLAMAQTAKYFRFVTRICE